MLGALISQVPLLLISALFLWREKHHHCHRFREERLEELADQLPDDTAV